MFPLRNKRGNTGNGQVSVSIIWFDGMMGNLKGVKVISRMRTIERKRVVERALNKKVIPISRDGLLTLQVDGVLSLETFKENIGRIFPLILLRISEGKSYEAIANELGLKRNTLINFLYDHPRLKSACEKARNLSTDKTHLERIELDSILNS